MLEVKNLSAWYGAAQALFDVSLHLGQGELLLLQGLNGAGKSTLLQTLIGLGPRVQGEVVFQNESMTDLPAHARALLGLEHCRKPSAPVKEPIVALHSFTPIMALDAQGRIPMADPETHPSSPIEGQGIQPPAAQPETPSSPQ